MFAISPLQNRGARTVAGLFVAGVFFSASAVAHADMTHDRAVSAARDWRAAHEHAIVSEFVALTSIPNVSADKPNIRRNAEFLVEMMRKRGLEARLLEAEGASPLAYGEWKVPDASRTYVFYAHYDGQPVDPAEWASPPFVPTLRSGRLDQGGEVIAMPAPGQDFDPDWRVYARSASDDKGPIVAMMTALDALKAAGIRPRANLKFVFEGEEEEGSTHLAQLLRAHRETLRSDLWVIGDGPEHRSGRQTVAFGIRGVQSLEITVYGPNRELHSGHYGNWAPNPAMMLARLLASMKDEDGRVLVEGFYDDVVPLSAGEREALRTIPDDDADLQRSLSLGRVEGDGKRLVELIALPSLNIRGLSSGRTGPTAANVVPSTATAAIDMRLVKGITHQGAIASVLRHIERQGYHVVRAPPDAATLTAYPKVAYVAVDPSGYDAARIAMDHPAAQRLVAALGAENPVLYPTMGGSLPLILVEETLGAPTITVPTVNYDNNQHSRDENLRLGHLWRSIETMAALLAME